MNIESNYGKCIATYKGKGVIIADGKNIDCKFEAGQLLDGSLILLCASNKVRFFSFQFLNITNFEGITTDGFKIKSLGRIFEINYLNDKPRSAKGVLALRLDELNIQIKTTKPRRVRFGITNFMFMGIESYNTKLSLPLELSNGTKTTNISIIPIEDYKKITLRIKTLKGVEVTCEAIAEYSINGGIRELRRIVDNLCKVMSVARGTKIQSIYCDFFDDKNACIRRLHSATITKPYCPMPLIDYGYEGRMETKVFLENSYKKYFELCDDFKFDRGMIDALLDARAENDYLEMRAAKLAVTLEKLKAVYVTHPASKAKEFTVDEALFQELSSEIQKEIIKILNTAKIDRDSQKAIASKDKILSLNRKSFAYIIRKLCKEIGLKVIEDDISLFIRCRNKLVHVGDFYCNIATRKEKARCKPLPSPREEYYFMINFLDRFYLKLLGYDGIYINWYSHMTNKPAREGV